MVHGDQIRGKHIFENNSVVKILVGNKKIPMAILLVVFWGGLLKNAYLARTIDSLADGSLRDPQLNFKGGEIGPRGQHDRSQRMKDQ